MLTILFAALVFAVVIRFEIHSYFREKRRYLRKMINEDRPTEEEFLEMEQKEEKQNGR
jgi:hypothetical protein